MANELTNVDTQNLSQQERTELDGQIEMFIERNKGNAYEINRITSEGAMILTSADKHSKEKAAQKFFERFRKNITGANNSTQNDINKKLAEAQYAAQQVIVKLAQQQQLSFEIISLVHEKLNAELLEVNKEINEIYNIQAATNACVDNLKQQVLQLRQKNANELKKIYGHLLRTDEDIKKLAKDIDLMTWAFNVKTHIYNGVKYCDLDDTTKIVCIVRDFFDIMQGKQGTINDLNTLETAIEHLGLTKIFREDFIRCIGTNDKLYNHLLGEDSRLDKFTTKHEEIIFAMQEARDTEIEDDRKNLPVTASEINDFVLELLYNLKQLTLAKELYDRAEKLFLSGNISEALPLLKILEADNVQARYMLAVIFHEGWIGIEANPDYVKSLLSENISAGDVCSIFFGVRIDLNPEETASNCFYTITKLADDGDVFAQYERAHYVHKDSGNISKYLELAADQNYFLAAYELGEMYYFGRNGADEDNEQARKYFEIAAKSEQHTGAMYYLGNIYWNGFGGAVNKKKAVELYMKIYEYGLSSDKMIFDIAEFYDNEEKNSLEAIRWLRIGAKQGYPKCLANLGLKYRYGVDIDKNWIEAVKYFERAIAAGEDRGVSEEQLGDMFYEGGNGITADKKKAVDWYKKAYERGNSSDNFINNIANFYFDIEKNYSEAIKWWRIGAEKNYPICLAHLGIQYYDGYVEKNWSESIKYFERAIAAGLSVGIPQKHLGNIYWEGGNGVIADKKKAVEWYKKAYERGNSSDGMINNVANFYDDIEKNSSEAVKWWQIGAEKNYPLCLSNLGWAYRFGHGVTKNNKEAIKYFERSIAAGNDSGYPEEILGDIYYEGSYGVTRDYEKSATYYEKAIAKGRKLSNYDRKNFAKAAYETGNNYYLSLGDKTTDYLKAAHWYEVAYNNGKDDSECAYHLGICNEELRYYSTALKWYERGAAKEEYYSASCAWYAGLLYKNGEGTAKDYWKAMRYFNRGIELGDRNGYCSESKAYILWEGGYGVYRDRSAAKKLYWRSAEKGNKTAQDWLIEHDEADITDKIRWKAKSIVN